MVLGLPVILRRTKSFQAAVRILNSLQNNAAVFGPRHHQEGLQLRTMQGFLRRTGVAVDELDKLSIIHVTGTKGKGSTCAFTERILRNHGFRTGFYSSPHLVHVRERIRIDGSPISKELFTKYFWEAYERLEITKDSHGGSMPFYFQFLTLLAFHVFLQERVDLAVIEVGIGGEYDCTNIIRRPWVCGLSSLGVDHSSCLGDTVEKIAWQKAGIFKPGVPAFTTRQLSGPLRVLQDRAEEIGCPLWVCPELDEYEAIAGPLFLGLAGKHQCLNASLALQLSYSWLQRQKAEENGDLTDGLFSAPTVGYRLGFQAAAFQPNTAMLKGLQETEWLGRNQTVRHGSVTYYLDGAHTTASMRACIHWFTQETLDGSQTCSNRGPGVKVLLFNTTGERNTLALLRLLAPCQFDYALFCPNITETLTNNTAHCNISLSAQHMLSRCKENQSSWQSLNATEVLHDQQRRLVTGPRSRTLIFPCIPDALRWISQGRDPVVGSSSALPPQSTELATSLMEAAHISVLVTGSLYLVGGALKYLDPSLDS